jgi:diguanylate cyclase (GGDEF)-like protein
MTRWDALVQLRAWHKLDNRLLSLVVSGIFLFALLMLGVVVGAKYENDQKNRVRNDLKTLAIAAARIVDGDKHNLIRQSGGLVGENEKKLYQEANTELRRFLQYHPELCYIYTLFGDGEEVRFGFDPTEPGDQDGDGRDDKAYWGEGYDVKTPNLMASIKRGMPNAEEEPQTDEWGTFMSAYAPFFDSQGEIAGVVGVDVRADAYLNAVSIGHRFYAGWFIASLLLAGFLGLWSMRLTQRVHRDFLGMLEANRILEHSNEELAHLNAQLDQLARTDKLTGVFNRMGFCAELESCLDELESGSETDCALAVMDLDGFKHSNDHYGHAFGDRMLVSFLEEVQSHLGDAVIGRMGGDEFIVLMKGENALNRLNMGLESLRERLSQYPLIVSFMAQFCSASVGVVGYFDRASGIDLMRRADIAMYVAKAQGPGNIVQYEPEMGEALERRVEMEHELRIAWERKQFWMAVQPIVDLERGRVIAGEMLIRWTREDGKNVSPAEFIPVAESMGLVEDMGLFAVEEACRNLERLGREFPSRDIHLSVNISPRQVNKPDFVERIEAIVDQYSIENGSLWLELTESSLIQEGADVLEKMTRLRDMGIRIALDDFGTGYSSLSMLMDIPLDCLKIDRSFVMRMMGDRQSVELVRMILELSRLLNLDVVAEGIESENEVRILRDMGCEWGQGFHYSRPIPMDEFVDGCGDYKKAA